MSNIFFFPHLSMVEALRLAHAQGARLVWRGGRVRMAPAGPEVLAKMAAMIEMIDRALEHMARKDYEGALKTVRSARQMAETAAGDGK